MLIKNFKSFFFVLSTFKLILLINASISLPECDNDIKNTCEETTTDAIEEYYYCVKDNNIYVLENEYSEFCINNFEVDSNVSLIKIDGASINQFSIGSSSSDEVSDSDLSKLVFLEYYQSDINQYILQKRNGIYVDKNSNYFYIYRDDNIDNIKIEITETSCINNIGGLAKVNVGKTNKVVLCLSETQYTVFPEKENDESYNLLKSSSTYAENSPFIVEEDYSMLNFGVNYVLDIYNKIADILYINYQDNKILTKDSVFNSKEISYFLYNCSSGECIENNYESTIYMYNDTIYNFTYDENDKITIEKAKENDVLAFQYNKNLDLDTIITEYDIDNGLSCEYSDIKIMNCQNENCERISGYIKYNYSNALQCDLKSCKIISNSIDCSKNINSVYYDGNTFYICTKQRDNSVSYVSIDQDNRFAFKIENDSQSIYKLLELNEKGNIITTPTPDSKYIKNSDEDDYIDVMICENKENESICKKNQQGYYIESDDLNDLIYCDSDKNCKISNNENGYFINSINKEVIKCINSECKLFTPGISCQSHNNEIILTDNVLYYCHNSIIKEIINSNYYLELSKIDASKIYPEISNGSDIILLYIDGFSVTQYITEEICVTSKDKILTEDKTCDKLSNIIYKCENINESCIATYNRCNPESPSPICNGYYLTNEDESTGVGILYNCIKESEDNFYCDTVDIPGYYKLFDEDLENANYVKCNDIECKKLKIPTKPSSNCISSNDIILYESKLMICVSDNQMIEFSSEKGKTQDEIIENNEKNAFYAEENGDYVIISISYYTILLKDISNVDSNIYMIDNKIYSITNDYSERSMKKVNKYGILAFYVDDDNNTILISDEDFDYVFEYSKIKLYECMKNNECNRTSGYMIYNQSTIIKCDFNSCIEFNNISECSSNNNIGKVYLDENSIFKICVNTDGINYEFKTIPNESNKNYIFTVVNSDSKKYNLYISNENGYIIGLSTIDGYYLIENNDNDTSEMFQCSGNIYGSECYIINYLGYFTNSISEKSDELIYCTEEGCQISKQSNGYFFNSNTINNVIRCRNSSCSIYENVKDLCSSSDISEIIVINNLNIKPTIYYCLQGKKISLFSETINYYELSNIKASAIYPSIVNGNDNILLQFDTYSVTQYINIDKEICISKDNMENSSCSSVEDKIYNCKSYSESCTSIINICNVESPTNVCKGYYLINIDNKTDEGILYKCTNDETVKCEIQDSNIGYYRVTDSSFKDVKYILCNGSSCKKVNTSSFNISYSCSSEIIGQLFIFDNTVRFCINNDEMIKFSSYINDEPKIYLLDNSNENIFGSKENGDFVFISVSYDYIILKNTSNVKTNDYLINENIYSIKNNNNVLSVSQLNIDNKFITIQHDSTSVYPEFSNVFLPESNFSNIKSNDLSNIIIYECKKNKCFKTKGYFLFGNNNSIAKCDSNKCEITDKNKNCNENSGGMAYYDKTLKFCFSHLKNNNKVTYDSKEIKFDEINYVYSLMENSYENYYIYMSYKNSNIIGLVSLEKDGYYLSDDDLNGDNKNDLLICSSTENKCKNKNENGYFFNSKSSDNNSLILCSKRSNCNIITETNGYFINTLNEVIQCKNSICRSYNKFKNCLIGYNYPIISSSNSINYCLDGTVIEFPISDEELYYEMYTNISLTYPVTGNGKDIILLKIDNYSVTQYITNSNYKCIKYDHTSDNNCLYVGSYKYMCQNTSKACTKTINICDPKKPTSICNGYYYVSDEKKIYNCLNNSKSVECNLLDSDGYYRMYNDDYVKCSNEKCTIIGSLKDLVIKSECIADDELFKDDYGNIYLCIYSEPIKIPSDGDASSIKHIKINNDNSSENIMILVSSSSIIEIDISKLTNNNYLISNELYSVKNGEIEKNSINYIAAFKKSNELYSSEIYSEISENEFSNDMSSFISDVKIVNCDKGKCIPTSGYLKYKNENEERIIKCNNNKCDPDSLLTSCDTGFAYYDSGFKVCINNEDSNDINIVKVRRKSIIFNISKNDNSVYDVYISDDNVNIIALVTIDGSYLLIDKVVICRNNKCIRSNYTGYFINSANKKSNELIFCDNNNKCNIIKQKNGIFINTLNEVIKCVDSKCEYITLENDCYDINNYSVALYENSLYFCNNDLLLKFSDTEKYIIAEHINTTSTFPDISDGNEFILLYMNQNSVTRYFPGFLSCVSFPDDGSTFIDKNKEIDSNICIACRSKLASCYITEFDFVKFLVILGVFFTPFILIGISALVAYYKNKKNKNKNNKEDLLKI